MNSIEAIGWLFEVENELVGDYNSFANRSRRQALECARRALALVEKDKACKLYRNEIALPFKLGQRVWKIDNSRGEAFSIGEYFVSNFRTSGDNHAIYAEVSPRGKRNFKTWVASKNLFETREGAEQELANIKSREGCVINEDSDGA